MVKVVQLQLTPEGPCIIFLSHNLLQHAMSGLPKKKGFGSLGMYNSVLINMCCVGDGD